MELGVVWVANILPSYTTIFSVKTIIPTYTYLRDHAVTGTVQIKVQSKGVFP